MMRRTRGRRRSGGAPSRLVISAACATSGGGAKVGKTGALPMKSLDVLMPAKGMPLIEDLVSARLPLHRLWLEPNPDLWLAELAPRLRAGAGFGGRPHPYEAY